MVFFLTRWHCQNHALFIFYSASPGDSQLDVLCYSEVDCRGAEVVVSVAQCCALPDGGRSYQYEEEPTCFNW